MGSMAFRWSALDWLRRRSAVAVAAAAFAMVLAGCETTPSRDASWPPAPGAQRAEDSARPTDRRKRVYDPDGFLTPPHMEDANPVRVALLLPFSAASENVRTVAGALFDAAQLAVFDAGDANLLLIPKDTGGTADGAARAAEAALQEGAELVLGPVFAQSVKAASNVSRAAGVPMIAFSTDLQVAGDGVYLLSFPPELEVARIADFAMLNGFSSFAALTPDTDYGRRVGDALAEEVYARAGAIVREESYEQTPSAMQIPAKRLARYDERKAALARERAQLRALSGNEIADRALEALEDAETFGDVGYDAVLLPEQGNLLRALAPLLPYYGVDIRRVKLLGTSLWESEALLREPALSGGWFAAPDPSMRNAFTTRYRTAYGAAPPRLASLAYDATTMAARLARRRARDRFGVAAIADPNGYLGVDGIFRFAPNGQIERGLAVLEINSGGFRIVDPAPQTFADIIN